MLRAYAKQAKNRQLEVDAAEIRIRAERRVGELIDAQKESAVGLAKGNAGKGRPKLGGAALAPPKTAAPPTLADAGIDKHLAKRARKLAAVPEERFEEGLADWREHTLRDSGRVSLPAVSQAPKIPRRKRIGPRTPGGALWVQIGELLDDQFDGLEANDQQMVVAMLQQMVDDLRERMEVAS
jgi:hypothetical protein